MTTLHIPCLYHIHLQSISHQPQMHIQYSPINLKVLSNLLQTQCILKPSSHLIQSYKYHIHYSNLSQLIIIQNLAISIMPFTHLSSRNPFHINQKLIMCFLNSKIHSIQYIIKSILILSIINQSLL
jgi:hypothetical protein